MAVGSSGGHIYPAVAVAEKLEVFAKKQNKSLSIHFVHSGSSLGKSIFSSLKYPVHEIPIGGLARGQSISQKIKTLFSIPKAFIQSFLLIKRLKARVIFGTGGAVTGPVLMAGFFVRRKTALWEGNAVMGLANKWLCPFVTGVFTVFSEFKNIPKKKHTVCAYPLREKIQSQKKQVGDRPIRSEKFSSYRREKTDKLKPDRYNSDLFKVLILGGSQGSVLLNRVVSQSVEEKDWRKDIFIYHQTGEKSFDSIKEKYQSVSGVSAFSFSFNIEEYYKKCDLIVSRAGSGAIGEVASHGKALVLVPLTYSAGGHQLKNALKLSSESCVEWIKEQDFNVKNFKEMILRLKQDEEKRKKIAEALQKAYKGEGSQKIADWLLSHI